MNFEEVELWARAATRNMVDPVLPGSADDVKVLTLPATDDFETPYSLLSISGLGSENMYHVVSPTDAEYLQTTPLRVNHKLGPREMVFLLGLRPEYTNGETPMVLRDRMYRKLFSSPIGELKLRFKVGHEQYRVINARVTKVETNMFVSTPQLQFTVVADLPWFYTENRLQTENVSPASAAHFWVEDQTSTAPHGMDMEFYFMTGSGPIGLLNRLTGERFTILPAGGITSFVPGDIVKINSLESERAVSLTRSGTTYNLAAGIQPQSSWPTIYPERKVLYELLGGLVFLGKNRVQWPNTYWGL